MTAVPGESRFKKFAIFCLGYNVLVILWGAYVRATGSGAGCGSHWPLCNGEIIPRPERVQTLIEFAHRSSSGLCLVFAVFLMGWAWKIFPRSHPARRASNWVVVLTVMEALIGAGLVLLSLVEHDKSVDRAFSISLHLVNTLFLLASLTLTVRWSSAHPAPSRPWDPVTRKWTLSTLAGTLVLGVTGALTALGDTLFKSASLTSGMASDFAQGSHFLLKIRILHPMIAVSMAVLFFIFSEFCQRHVDSENVRKWARLLQMAVLAQVLIGVANLILLAPITVQILHLLMADLAWISLIMLCSATLEVEALHTGLGMSLQVKPS